MKIENLDKKKISGKEILWVIVLFGFLIRGIAAANFFEYLDLGTWNIPWAQAMSENPFSGYARIENLDYPPIFPTLLGLIGIIMPEAPVDPPDSNTSVLMFLIKLIPILFDLANIVLFYLIGKKKSETVGLIAAAFWALNPSLLFNVSYWGQSDSILIFLLALTFWLLEEDHPTAASIIFAISCLTKLQAVYFSILFVLRLFQKYEIKKSIMSLSKGILVGILGWIPYMIGSKELLLPLRIYLGGFGSYPYINLNAYNLYGIVGNNFVPWNKSFLGIGSNGFNEKAQILTGGLTYQMIGSFFLIFIFVSLVSYFLFFGKKGKEFPSYFVALLYSNAIFILTMSQHERYQIPALAFAMLCCIATLEKSYFRILTGITIITFFNQISLIMKYEYWGIYETLFRPLQLIFSIANVLLFIYLSYTVIKSFKKEAQVD